MKLATLFLRHIAPIAIVVSLIGQKSAGSANQQERPALARPVRREKHTRETSRAVAAGNVFPLFR